MFISTESNEGLQVLYGEMSCRFIVCQPVQNPSRHKRRSGVRVGRLNLRESLHIMQLMVGSLRGARRDAESDCDRSGGPYKSVTAHACSGVFQLDDNTIMRSSRGSKLLCR